MKSPTALARHRLCGGRRSVTRLFSCSILLGMGFGAAGQFVAINDHGSGPATHPNVTSYTLASTTPVGGPLTNLVTGELLLVGVAITNSGASWSSLSRAPATGTPAHQVFNAYVDWTNGYTIYLDGAADVVGHVFTNLNPNAQYRFAGTAIRGGTGSYTNRCTLFALVGAESFTAAHTAGTITPGQLPSLNTNQAILRTGGNTAGDLVAWEGIQPGADGSFAVMSSRYTGPLPDGGTASDNAYSLQAFQLEEVIPALAITAQPQDLTVVPGEAAQLAVETAGVPPLVFQWFRGTNPPVEIPGATTATLSVNPAALEDSGAYFVVVSDASGAVTSRVATLRVAAESVVITSEPQDIAVAAGQSTLFQVAATGAGTISCQWYRDALPIPGATNLTLIIQRADQNTAGVYHAVLSNSLSIVSTRAAALQVNFTPLVITLEPDDTSVYYGSTVRLICEVSGSLPEFQWFRNGAAIPAATNAVFTLPSARPEHSGLYHVVATNFVSSAIGRNVFVTVGAAPHQLITFTNTWRYDQSGAAPAGAWFSESYDDTGWTSGPGVFGFPASEPLPSADRLLTVLNSLAPGSTTQIKTYYFRTTFVFPEATQPAPLVASNLIDDGAVFYLNGEEIARVGMPSGPITYFTGAARAIDVSWDVFTIAAEKVRPGTNVLAVELHQPSGSSSDAVFGMTLTAMPPPPTALSITRQPLDLDLEEGQQAVLSVGISGNLASYQWFRNGQPIPGANQDRYALDPAVAERDAGLYSVTASNFLNTVVSREAIVTIAPDYAGPELVEAEGLTAPTQLRARFSEPVAPDTATNLAQFQLRAATGETLAITSAVMLDSKTVELVTEPRSPEVNYILTATGIRDLSPLANPRDSRVPVLRRQVLIPWDAAWDFNNPIPTLNREDLGAAWRELDYPLDAPDWRVGQAAFAQPLLPPAGLSYPVPARTDLYPGVNVCYFRKTFEITGALPGRDVRLRAYVDDGAVFYLNGQEIARFNMSTNELRFDSPAATNCTGPVWFEVTLPIGGLFSLGTNVFAAELHGSSLSDADWFFALELETSFGAATGPVLITRQPQSQMVLEGQNVTFDVTAVAAAHYQWFRNDSLLTGETGSVLTIPRVPRDLDGAQFHVVVSNATSLVTSTAALLTVRPDTVAPVLRGATIMGTNSIGVAFSEALDANTATNPANYTVTNTSGERLLIPAVTLSHGGTNAILHLNGLPPGNWTLEVNGLGDASAGRNPVLPHSTVIPGWTGPLVLPNDSTLWQYHDGGIDLGIAWRSPNYDDSGAGWSNGPALFGAGDLVDPEESVRTPMRLGWVTYYFRHQFLLPQWAPEVDLSVRLLVDDGAVLYLNGRELLRRRMTDPITYERLAANLGGLNFEPPQSLTTTNFVLGTNLLAAEVHQSSLSSRDLAFALELHGSLPSRAIWAGSSPILATLAASDTTPSGATLTGVVQPSGLPTHAWFEWVTASGSPSRTPALLITADAPRLFSDTLSGLFPGTSYRYRAVASNAAGLVYGPEFRFETVAGGVRLGDVTKREDGGLQFSFSGTAAVYNVLASTNAASGYERIGAAVESPANSGRFLFIDPFATNHPHRFYKVRAD